MYQPYFCTITCYRWLALFEIANAHEEVYKWFEYIRKEEKCEVLGYVIMPNHIHCILFPKIKNLNKIVSEGKRFMAYGMVKKLKEQSQIELLKELADGVQENERKKGKKHQIFRLSFDAKLCVNQTMLEQKLSYIHHNPISGKWDLANDFTNHEHSSAGFYELGSKNEYVTHYKEILNELFVEK